MCLFLAIGSIEKHCFWYYQPSPAFHDRANQLSGVPSHRLGPVNNTWWRPLQVGLVAFGHVLGKPGYTEAAFPQDWATTQNNLGNA